MFEFLLGIGLFSLLEPIIINFVYMSNPGLFLDLILTEKNVNKLKEEFEFEKRWEDCD